MTSWPSLTPSVISVKFSSLMPRLMGNAFTRSPSSAKTTSTGLAASRDFGSEGSLESGLALAALAGGLFDSQAAVTLFVVFGGRVVTLWKGTLKTFVRERVSIVAV